MGLFNNSMSGGRSISAGALNPRASRGSTGQVAAYWAGGASGPNASGGFAAVASTGLGYNYLQFRSTSSLTVIEGGTFEFLCFGGGGGGRNGNGYNSFGAGGGKGGTGNLTVVLPAGVYTVTVGGGGSGATSNTYYNETGGTASYFHTYSSGGNAGSGGAGNGNGGGTSANGQAGTQVNTFIGGASLFKAAGGGNSISGIGGSGIGGNGSNGSPGNSTSAAANTASGGGGSGGSGQPVLQGGNGGNGGTGIV